MIKLGTIVIRQNEYIPYYVIGIDEGYMTLRIISPQDKVQSIIIDKETNSFEFENLQSDESIIAENIIIRWDSKNIPIEVLNINPFSIWLSLSVRWFINLILFQHPLPYSSFLAVEHCRFLRESTIASKRSQTRSGARKYRRTHLSFSNWVKFEVKNMVNNGIKLDNISGWERSLEKKMYKRFGTEYTRSMLFTTIKNLKILNKI